MKELLSKRLLTKKFSVEGKNLSVFSQRLSREGVTILSIEPTSSGAIIVIPSSESKKLFAICEKMCYNIILEEKKIPDGYRKNRPTLRFIRDGGLIYPLVSFFKRPGLVLGILAFIFSAVILNGTLLGFSLEEVPINERSAVVKVIKECGAKKFTPFSAIDLAEIESAIEKQIPSVSFASVEKKGCYIKVQTLASFEGSAPLEKKDALSEVDGVIQKIAVYRGTPLVKVGDSVSVGTPLVGAFYAVGEETVSTLPVYDIAVKCVFSFSLETRVGGEGARLAVIALAKEKCPESNIIDCKTETVSTENGEKITVYIEYIKHLRGG